MRRRICAVALVLAMLAVCMPYTAMADTEQKAASRTQISSVDGTVKESYENIMKVGNEIPAEKVYESEELGNSLLANVPDGAAEITQMWMIRDDKSLERDELYLKIGDWASAEGTYGKVGTGRFEKGREYLLLFVIEADRNHEWDGAGIEVTGAVQKQDVEILRDDGGALYMGIRMGVPTLGGDGGSRFIATAKTEKRSITLSWSKVSGAASYRVYFAKCGRKYAVIKKVKAGTLSFRKKGLRKGGTYKMYVEALNSKGRVIASTPRVHAVTEGGVRSNVRRLKAPGTVSVEAGKRVKLNVSVAEKTSRRKLMTGHVSKDIRFYSSNTKAATVDDRGVVKGVYKGTANIYAVASNGVKTVVKVKVDEPASPVPSGTPVYIEGILYWLDADTWQEAADKGLTLKLSDYITEKELKFVIKEYESEDYEIEKQEVLGLEAVGEEGSEGFTPLRTANAMWNPTQESVIKDFGKIRPYSLYLYREMK